MRYAVLIAGLLLYTATIAQAAPQATLTVTAYVDLNGNGTMDANEPPASGIDWVATDDRSVYHCFTGDTGTCGWSLPPGRWYINAYHNFDMIHAVDVQLDGDLMIVAAVQPETVYLPVVAK